MNNLNWSVLTTLVENVGFGMLCDLSVCLDNRMENGRCNLFYMKENWASEL